MRKKTLVVLAAGVLAVSAAAIGGTAAYQVSGGNVTQAITTQSLNVELTGDGVDGASQVNVEFQGMPGDTLEKEVKVKSTGEIPLYARVTIDKFWLDGEGNKIPLENGDMIRIEVSDNSQWIVKENNAEQVTMYYTKPLGSDQETSNVMENIKLSPEMGNDFADKKFQLDIRVDAVQTTGAEAAILSEWGVAAQFDGDTITDIVE